MNKTLSSTGVDANVIIIIIIRKSTQDIFKTCSFLLESIKNTNLENGVCLFFVYSLIKLGSPSIS